MLDIKLFRIRKFSGASLSIGLAFFALFGAIYFLTQYLQGVLDLSAFEAGAGTTPVALGLVIGGPLSAKLVGRFGTRNIVSIGLVGVAAGMFLLAGLDTGSGYTQVMLSIIVLGFGMGMTMAPATESIMSSLPASHAGVGSAMNDAVRLVGGTFGVAILGSLLSSGYRGDMESETAALPPEAAGAAGDSLGAASALADKIGGQGRQRVECLGRDSVHRRDGHRPRGGIRSRAGRCPLAFTVLPKHKRQRSGAPALAPEAAAASRPRRQPMRGRPRSVEADSAIFGAVFQLLPESGLKGLTMEAVAKQAGVSKATVYRRWSSKQELVMDVLSAIPPPQLEVEDTGSLIGDLDALAAQQIERIGDTGLPRLLPRLLSEGADDPAFLKLARERLSQPLQRAVATLMQRAIDRGELRKDFDLEPQPNMVHAYAVYTLLMNGGDLRAAPNAGKPVVALLKEGIGASSSSAGRASARRRSSGSSRAKPARS